MDKKTNLNKTYNVKWMKISMLLCILGLCFLVSALMYVYKTPDIGTGFFLSRISMLYILWFCVALIIAGLIGSVLGIIKGKLVITKENKFIKEINPYVYYRELPNSFGIGVTSLLLDSTIENDKDIVAVILDLCARKYLNLMKQENRYVIKVLKVLDEGLLSNEAYVLSMILDNNIKNIDYKKWYNCCMQDGMELGLYYHVEANIKNKPILTKNRIKNKAKNYILIILITTVLVAWPFLIFEGVTSFTRVVGFWILFVLLVGLGPLYFLDAVTTIAHVLKQSRYKNYKNILNNKLIRTKKGVVELQKIYAFKSFINDFGNFIDKKPEEVMLWDRYLSYAHVFGLTKEIMESGYKEIINNSSFYIDSMDNIKLDNIDIK